MSYSLTIGWIYPKLMNVYGDRGNIISLEKRCEWRGISTDVRLLNPPLSEKELEECDLIMMGGAQDEQQKIVSSDLKKKSKLLKRVIDEGVPGLYVCGAYQFLGNYYKEADGTILKGLGIFDLYTENPGTQRLIGNIMAQTKTINTNNKGLSIVGFENHGGRTILGEKVKPFAKVVEGFGNNGKDHFEGAIYKNSIGTYMHGPLLPKNPEVADWLILKALEKKYGKTVKLKPLDDSLENKTRESILRRI